MLFFIIPTPAQKRLDIVTAIKSKHVVELTKLGKTVKYVQLETTDIALLADIKKIVIDKYIYILTINGVFKFDFDGTFIKKIGKKGRGPQEFLSCHDFDVINEVVGIFDILLHKVFQYNSEGKFIGTISNRQDSDKFLRTENHFHLFSSTPPTFWGAKDSGILAHTYNNVGKLLSITPNKNKGTHSCYKNSYTFQNKLYVRQILNDTVFAMSDFTQEPKYIIDRGIYKPQKCIYSKNEKAKGISCKYMAENNRCVFLRFSKIDGSKTRLIYDKLSNELTTIKNGVFINNIDNGLSFWPSYVTNNYMVKPLTYLSLLELKETNNFGTALNSKFKQMDSNSNPILMIITE